MSIKVVERKSKETKLQLENKQLKSTVEKLEKKIVKLEKELNGYKKSPPQATGFASREAQVAFYQSILGERVKDELFYLKK